jgi:hypothetical protein
MTRRGPTVRNASLFAAAALVATALSGSLDASAALSRFDAPNPALCSRGEIRTLVERFAEAFNRGAFRTLDREVFAEKSEFRWYSTGGPGARLNRAAHNRATLHTGTSSFGSSATPGSSPAPARAPSTVTAVAPTGSSCGRWGTPGRGKRQTV